METDLTKRIMWHFSFNWCSKAQNGILFATFSTFPIEFACINYSNWIEMLYQFLIWCIIALSACCGRLIAIWHNKSQRWHNKSQSSQTILSSVRLLYVQSESNANGILGEFVTSCNIWENRVLDTKFCVHSKCTVSLNAGALEWKKNEKYNALANVLNSKDNISKEFLCFHLFCINFNVISFLRASFI